MRTIRRAAVIRVIPAILGAFLGVSCTLPQARADDASVTTLQSPSPPHHFGDAGDVIVPAFGVTLNANGIGGSVMALQFSHTSIPDGVGSREEQTDFAFSPTADFFVARHFSIGGTIFGDYIHLVDHGAANNGVGGTDAGFLDLGFAPRVGVLFTLNDHLALWPRLGVGLSAFDSMGDGTFAPPATPFEVTGSIDVQLVYSVDRHLYASFDPSFSVSGFPKNGGYDSAFATAFGTSFAIGFVL